MKIRTKIIPPTDCFSSQDINKLEREAPELTVPTPSLPLSLQALAQKWSAPQDFWGLTSQTRKSICQEQRSQTMDDIKYNDFKMLSGCPASNSRGRSLACGVTGKQKKITLSALSASSPASSGTGGQIIKYDYKFLKLYFTYEAL